MMKTQRLLLTLSTLLAFTSIGLSSMEGPEKKEVFRDDFESGMDRWDVSDPSAIAPIDSGDPNHGKVLRMAPSDARLHALIRGSEAWGHYRIEGDVLFPDDDHNYLGFIYNFRESERRVDLGSIYIKGNGSYIRVNPRRDWNPARAMYEEFRTPLTGNDAIRIGHWQRFAAEVVGRSCHFYVGDMETPKVTFDFYEYDSGQAGFKPRVVGGPVWIDNIRVISVEDLSYQGPQQPPGIDYMARELVTEWEVLGPLSRNIEELEKAESHGNVTYTVDGNEHRWRTFETDPRGAVVTGRVIDYVGSRTVAYFKTSIDVEGTLARLKFSTVDNLAIWVNGVFRGYLARDQFAWFDFERNPEHPHTSWSVPLSIGKNDVVIRVRGGQYATGGFYARVAN
jgi:hypothetical protein